MIRIWSALLARSCASRFVMSGPHRADGPDPAAGDRPASARLSERPAAYLAIYLGHPRDSASFDRYYIERHVPILRHLPKIRSIEVLKGAVGGEDSVYQIVEMRFDSLDDLNRALKSAARAEAAEDRRRVLEPSFDGQIFNQTVLVAKHR